MKNQSVWVVVAWAAIWVSGCASDIKYSRLPTDADPSKELTSLSQKIEQDRNAQVDVYAPSTFAKAERAFKDANQDRASNGTPADILDSIAKSRAYLTVAETRSHQAQGALGEVVVARTRAAAANAPSFSSSSEQYAMADQKVARFTHNSDEGSGVASISDRDRMELLAAYQESELHAISQKKLGHARTAIKAARNEGAEQLAPKSLAMAEAKVTEAMGVVRRDRSDVKAIQTAADSADQAADRLLEVTRLAKASTTKHPEDLASARLNDESAIADLQNERSTLRGNLQKTTAELASAGALSDTVRMIQSKFKPDEAMVYEDGKQVHIRLKNLKFPSGSSTIQTSAYPVMGKLESILQTTQPSMVRIDGRTDSVGSKKKNQALSKARAESVKEFLAASSAIDPSKVTTEGFDYQRPIAAEKDSQGRSLNRGIDVILVPGNAPAASDTAKIPANGSPSASSDAATQPAGG